MKKITIITSTYNRSTELEALYESLYAQTSKNFKWLIVDDGSSDNTEKIVKKFSTAEFPIKYIYKENGGKHTALNLAFDVIDTELMIIVDSDDKLVSDAINIILKDWKKYKYDNHICGLVYPKIDINENYVSQKFKEFEFEENYNSYIINEQIKGDKAEVFKTEIIKKFKFPEYKNERFIGEGVLWSKIARNYNMIFIDKPIYVCNYLENGLTKSGRKMRINNPLGGMYHAEEYLDKIYTFKIREKNALLYLTYAIFAKKNVLNLILKNKYKFILFINIIPSILLYIIWNRKYK